MGGGIRTNEDRAQRAYRAVVTYWGDDGPEDTEVKVSDLLCDLMHLLSAVTRRVDDDGFVDPPADGSATLHGLLASAAMNYHAEVAEEAAEGEPF